MPRVKKQETLQASLRLPVELYRRADQLAEELTRANPGMVYTRTDAIRVTLANHLPPLREDRTAAEVIKDLGIKTPRSRPNVSPTQIKLAVDQAEARLAHDTPPARPHRAAQKNPNRTR